MKPKRQIYREGANGEKGIIFVSFTLLLMVLIVGVGAVYAFAFADYRASLRNEWFSQALHVAEAGIDQKLVELTQRNTANMTGTLNFSAGGGVQGRYDVFYGVVATDPNTGVKAVVNPNTGAQVPVSEYTAGDEVVISTGSLLSNGTEQARRVLRATVRSASIISPRAAVAISGVASTNGAVIVDGREHDANGNLIAGQPGKFGVSTSTPTFNQGGNSKVGGNGIPPANPANPATYELNAPPLPDTPEKVLGVSAGALDQYKTGTPPSSAFNGIVYLTTSWIGVNLDGSSGILICHNAAGDAVLQNLHGNFKGLIVTDDIVHINGDAEIIGAVFGLKTGGVTLGNGSGEVKFSSEVLANLPLRDYKVTSWEDARND